MNIVSFVDRDMVMHYFGGGIGHLKNVPPQQVPGFDPIDPGSEEMPVEEEELEDDDDPCSNTNEGLGSTVTVQQPYKNVVNGGDSELVQMEVSQDDEDRDEDDEENSDGNEGEDQTDEDDEESDSEDDYGYASP
jgi:hypothetical protein